MRASKDSKVVYMGKLKKVMEMPYLLDIQLASFNWLLQADVDPEDRKNVGLQAVFNEIFPISDIQGNYSLEFEKYIIGVPKYSENECRERDMTYSVPLKALLKLVVMEQAGDQKRVKEIIKKEVFLGELPLLTDLGTFIVNGAERVIVSQLHRSPGVVFEENTHPNGQKLFSARIIPFRGSWVEFSLDLNDVLYVHIDKRKKFPVTALLRTFGYSTNEAIFSIFLNKVEVSLNDTRKKGHSKGGENLEDKDILGFFMAEDVVDQASGEVLSEVEQEVTEELLKSLREKKVQGIKVFIGSGRAELRVLKNTLKKDPTQSEEEALVKIYNLLRPGDPPNLETARQQIVRLFFDPKRYDLGLVGRFKINQRLEQNTSLETTTLTKEDFIKVIRYMFQLREGEGNVDDIDHLGNRRVRSIGELIADQMSVGLSRMARLIRERMSLMDAENISLDDLVNARTVSAVINTFFGSSQLSQFKDQTNPLAELTHKRRLSALGPGGLTRERAGFEVRDVHYSHYGRMCPIETPEGPNIGLISSLTTYARINEMGFIETPYRIVENGRVSNKIHYLTAIQEEQYFIAQANELLDDKGYFKNKLLLCRKRGDFPMVKAKQIDYMDVSPDQIVSVAAALIPFLEHDDANRALMGSNMQRQAVPLLNPEAPLVGTGLEERVARDSGAVIVAKRAGTVESVTATEISINLKTTTSRRNLVPGLSKRDIYRLRKFQRTNQDTAINQRPSVKVGDEVEAGQMIANGTATDKGELALGRNVVVAFLPWYGYNFEDAIVISEKLVKEDAFTSVHIQELELHVRDTKRGMEEITREVPNVGEDTLGNLDDRGLIRVGAHIHPGDILVGKISPKGETELSPEERLLTAIFGEKARDVKDSSLKAPPGLEGTVIDVMIFSRLIDDPLTSDDRMKSRAEAEAFESEEIAHVLEARDEEVRQLVAGEVIRVFRKAKTNRPLVKAGTKLGLKELKQIDLSEVDLASVEVERESRNEQLSRLITAADTKIAEIKEKTLSRIEKINQPDELPPGIVQLVKVYVAQKRKLSVGDKMAGRHGNKGIVAKIVPEEDMPYLPDGTPVEVILNPLGVPSRMNVGQILETHLGWAAQILGLRIKSPVFHGATEEEIRQYLKKASLPTDGKVTLVDGRTGQPFEHKVTVGYIYILKLLHLVDDKIHSRSIGPYSLVTQQPLAGKAQFGGQRFGEMEVWALEAYGAAHTLQEILTVKSDDVSGRSKVYEAIVKGENLPEPGIPESFNVLVKELQSLGLSVTLGER